MIFYNTEDCLKVEKATKRVMERLPASVNRWLDKNVVIVMDDIITIAYGIKLDGQKRVIILRQRAKRLSYVLLETLIAHEFAHHYLGHNGNGRYSRNEASARRLTKEWGFDETELDNFIEAHNG